MVWLEHPWWRQHAILLRINNTHWFRNVLKKNGALKSIFGFCFVWAWFRTVVERADQNNKRNRNKRFSQCATRQNLVKIRQLSLTKVLFQGFSSPYSIKRIACMKICWFTRSLIMTINDLTHFPAATFRYYQVPNISKKTEVPPFKNSWFSGGWINFKLIHTNC